MKRIAVISYHTCPRASVEGKETGGMNVYVMELFRTLAAMGHSVDIFTRSHEANDPLIIEEAPHLRVIHLPAGPKSQVAKKTLKGYIVEFTDELFRFIQSEGFPYDIIHAHYYMSGLIAQKILSAEKRRLVGTAKFVISFHTLAIMKNLVARDEEEKEDASRIEAEVMLAHEADAVVASSQSDKEYIQYLYGVPEAKIRCVPPGVNTDLFRPINKAEAKEKIGMHEDSHGILFVGRIEPLKGIDELLYATKILVARNPDLRVCVCIVGGDIRNKPMWWPKTLKMLDDLRRTLQLTTEVNFVGQQPQEKLPYYYNAADVVVMPSHYESFGMAALEAMSCGVPVITTNVAGISSLIDEKHSSLITTVNNPLLLASQIEGLLLDPEKHAAIASTLRHRVLDLSWTHVAERIDRVYDDVIMANA